MHCGCSLDTIRIHSNDIVQAEVIPMNRQKKYTFLFFTLFLTIMLITATVCLIQLVSMDAHADAVKVEEVESDLSTTRNDPNNGDSFQYQQYQNISKPQPNSAKYTIERPKVDSIDGIPLTVDLIPNGLEGRPGTKRTVRYVVIHETGNTDPGTGAANHARLLTSGENGSTSWHYTVDDHEIYQHLPDNEVGWHCGDGREGPGNQTGIGIELCVNPEGDFENTFDNAARLTAFLLESYDLTLQDVRQHHDFSGKNCPEQIREQNRWKEFLDLVQTYLKD